MSGRRGARRSVRADEESTVSDIRIGADGRVHVFGTSREILEALDAIGVRGDAVRVRLGAPAPPRCDDQVRASTAPSSFPSDRPS
jgi:hypothetical protein